MELLHTVFKMEGDPASMVALGRSKVADMLSEGQEDELLDQVYAAFRQYSADKDMVIIEGSHRGAPPASIGFQGVMGFTLCIGFIGDTVGIS